MQELPSVSVESPGLPGRLWGLRGQAIRMDQGSVGMTKIATAVVIVPSIFFAFYTGR